MLRGTTNVTLYCVRLIGRSRVLIVDPEERMDTVAGSGGGETGDNAGGIPSRNGLAIGPHVRMASIPGETMFGESGTAGAYQRFAGRMMPTRLIAFNAKPKDA